MEQIPPRKCQAYGRSDLSLGLRRVHRADIQGLVTMPVLGALPHPIGILQIASQPPMDGKPRVAISFKLQTPDGSD